MNINGTLKQILMKLILGNPTMVYNNNTLQWWPIQLWEKTVNAKTNIVNEVYYKPSEMTKLRENQWIIQKQKQKNDKTQITDNKFTKCTGKNHFIKTVKKKNFYYNSTFMLKVPTQTPKRAQRRCKTKARGK